MTSVTMSAEADTSFRFGVELARQGRLDAAEAIFRWADERGHAAAASNLGVLLEERGDRAAAKDAYRRADDRGEAAGAFNLGALLEADGDLDAAQAAYRRANDRGHVAAEAYADAAVGVAPPLQQRGEATELRQARQPSNAAARPYPAAPDRSHRINRAFDDRSAAARGGAIARRPRPVLTRKKALLSVALSSVGVGLAIAAVVSTHDGSGQAGPTARGVGRPPAAEAPAAVASATAHERSGRNSRSAVHRPARVHKPPRAHGPVRHPKPLAPTGRAPAQIFVASATPVVRHADSADVGTRSGRSTSAGRLATGGGDSSGDSSGGSGSTLGSPDGGGSSSGSGSGSGGSGARTPSGPPSTPSGSSGSGGGSSGGGSSGGGSSGGGSSGGGTGTIGGGG
jgi:hypothetical protein